MVDIFEHCYRIAKSRWWKKRGPKRSKKRNNRRWSRHRGGRLPLRRRTATGRDTRWRKTTTWRWWWCRLDCEWTLMAHVPVFITMKCRTAGVRIDRVFWMPNEWPPPTSSRRHYCYVPLSWMRPKRRLSTFFGELYFYSIFFSHPNHVPVSILFGTRLPTLRIPARVVSIRTWCVRPFLNFHSHCWIYGRPAAGENRVRGATYGRLWPCPESTNRRNVSDTYIPSRLRCNSDTDYVVSHRRFHARWQ